MKLNKTENGIFYRENTTDLNCIREVMTKNVYEHKKLGFFIKKGENWLDLGGNIGAFGLFCDSKGATCTSFEPIEENYNVMKKNYKDKKGLRCENFSVTNSTESKLSFFKGNKDSDRYRFTTKKKSEKFFEGNFNNVHASIFDGIEFDGVKIDIECSEFGLLDDRLIPKCNKLVMEYHISKDRDFKNFDKRMNYLREIFDMVYYMPSLDRFSRDEKYPGAFDRMIYCMNNGNKR